MDDQLLTAAQTYFCGRDGDQNGAPVKLAQNRPLQVDG